MQQRVHNSEVKCKGNYCGRRLALYLQSLQGTIDTAMGNEVAVHVQGGRQNIPTKCRYGKPEFIMENVI